AQVRFTTRFRTILHGAQRPYLAQYGIAAVAIPSPISRLQRSGPNARDYRLIVSHHPTNSATPDPVTGDASQQLLPPPPPARKRRRKSRRKAREETEVTMEEPDTPEEFPLCNGVEFHLCCMSPHVVFQDLKGAWSVVLTSGTLSPMGSFQSELGLRFDNIL
ncbi:MAG: hypothetical protein AAF471_09270, partial [Myxococcota bacterium]